MMKKLMMLALVAVAVLVVGVVVLFLNKNTLTKEAIERSLSFVLEVDVTLDKVELSLGDGSVELYGLQVPSPEGYKTHNVFSFEQMSVAIDPASLTGDTMRIKEFSTDSIQLGYEKKNLKMSNLKELIDSASRFSTGEAAAEEEKPSSKEEEEAGRDVQIDLISVKKTGVSLAAPALAQDISFTLPSVTIKDIGTADNQAVTVAQAVTIFLKELLSQTIQGSQGQIPDEILAAMKGNLADVTQQLDAAKDQAKEAIKGLKEAPGELLDNLKDGGGAVDGVKEGAKEASENIKKGLGGLLKK